MVLEEVALGRHEGDFFADKTLYQAFKKAQR